MSLCDYQLGHLLPSIEVCNKRLQTARATFQGIRSLSLKILLLVWALVARAGGEGPRGREPSQPVRVSFNSAESKAVWEQKELVWGTQGAWGQLSKPQMHWRGHLLPSLQLSVSLPLLAPSPKLYPCPDKSPCVALYSGFTCISTHAF